MLIKKINGTDYANTNSVRNLHQVSSANPKNQFFIPSQTSNEKLIPEDPPLAKPRGRVGLAPMQAGGGNSAKSRAIASEKTPVGLPKKAAVIIVADEGANNETAQQSRSIVGNIVKT